MTPEQAELIFAWNAANRAARAEYEMHPFSGKNSHNAQCAAMGCEKARATRKKSREVSGNRHE